MPDEPEDWADLMAWAMRMARREPGRPKVRAGDRCSQCSFPWYLHPWRFDSQAQAMVRYCSRFPARAVRAIEACIAP